MSFTKLLGHSSLTTLSPLPAPQTSQTGLAQQRVGKEQLLLTQSMSCHEQSPTTTSSDAASELDRFDVLPRRNKEPTFLPLSKPPALPPIHPPQKTFRTSFAQQQRVGKKNSWTQE
jgi:hypothetical protein